jgi:glutamate-1-semialdehyde 2,1-aminomutase
LVSEASKPDQWGDDTEPNSVIEPSANPSVTDEVVVMPWNNKQACQNILDRHKDQLAAVVVDPLPCSMGVIPPRPGFLEFLREVTETNGILLVADEVMSFRLNYHGACYDYGIKPDLTSLAKIIGGGFPVGAIGGRDDVMEVFDHTKGYKVHHGGTFNANPVTMTAGLATMKQLTPEAYDRLNGMGGLLREKLTHLFTRKEIPAQVTGKGSLFWVHLTDNEIVDYRSVVGYTQGKPIFNDLAHEMLGHGIVAAGRGFGNLSTPMTEEELDIYVDALDASLTKLNYR